MLNKEILLALYERLYSVYGPQNWWPADTPFEVMVGAVLTQNTNWKNVEKALENLRQADALELESILALGHDALAEHIRPSGYFNIKACRLKNLCSWLSQNDKLDGWPTEELRAGLLSVNGIGPETADDILLYALDRPVFVIDTYTRRLLKALKLIEGEEGYEDLRQMFESGLEPDVTLFNEYHALIVRHAKEKCQQVDDCLHCHVEKPLRKP